AVRKAGATANPTEIAGEHGAKGAAVVSSRPRRVLASTQGQAHGFGGARLTSRRASRHEAWNLSPGIRSAISDARRPRSAPPCAADHASPAMPWRSTPAHAASKAGIVHASAPITPPRRSPEPAVPSAGQATGDTARRASGETTIVCAPLRTTTAPVAAQSSRADRNRSLSTWVADLL